MFYAKRGSGQINASPKQKNLHITNRNYPLSEDYKIYEKPLDLYQPSAVDTKSNILYNYENYLRI